MVSSVMFLIIGHFSEITSKHVSLYVYYWTLFNFISCFGSINEHLLSVLTKQKQKSEQNIHIWNYHLDKVLDFCFVLH